MSTSKDRSPANLTAAVKKILRGYRREETARVRSGVAAYQQKRRVRFTTAAGLVNELVEAKHQLQLRRVLARWSCYELIVFAAYLAYSTANGNRSCALNKYEYTPVSVF